MEAVTVTTVLMILGSAFGVMFAAIVSVMFMSIRLQHRDNRETRHLISDTNLETRQLISDTNLETRQLISDTNLETRQEAARQIERLGDRLSGELAEHKRIVEKNHDELRADHGKVVESLGDARERLARIESHLHIPPPPPPPRQAGGPADLDDGDTNARAA